MVGPFSQDNDFAKELAEEYEEKFQDEPNQGVNAGYIAGLAWEAIFERACSDGDMTREGVLKAKPR